MPNIYDFALNLMRNNPQVAETPMGKNFMNALQNRDTAQGEELANNILQSQGMTKDSALNDIQSRVPGFPFFK